MESTAFHRILRPLLLSVIILGCSVIMVFMYFKPATSWLPDSAESVFKVPSPKPLSTKSNKHMIVVLIWIWPFGQVYDLRNCSSRFNIDGCFITADRRLYSKADAVIIHHRDIRTDLSNLPKLKRPSFQKWIWINAESPTHCAQLPGLNNVFNLTANYHQDSDIPVPYGYIVPAEREEDFIPPKKDKLVCWIVSNWNPYYKRVDFYNEFKKHVQIHTFGRAFGKHISDKDFLPTMASCKFYLSFENSIHWDYITEKLYNPLSVGTVPVVLGPPRQNYENFVQGDAFIHVNDFTTPKELADYLLLLDKDEKKYLRYFDWRRHFKAELGDFPLDYICLSCDHLHRHKEYKTVNNLNKWFWSN